ncbi:hypothetical protein C8Q80DRAFT_743279 [Daedaleopsis nitida]|nr:hypothetical protein C8Q80DRAFT_743279 [Daedaleopsis nitida]
MSSSTSSTHTRPLQTSGPLLGRRCARVTSRQCSRRLRPLRLFSRNCPLSTLSATHLPLRSRSSVPSSSARVTRVQCLSRRRRSGNRWWMNSTGTARSSRRCKRTYSARRMRWTTSWPRRTGKTRSFATSSNSLAVQRRAPARLWTATSHIHAPMVSCPLASSLPQPLRPPSRSLLRRVPFTNRPARRHQLLCRQEASVSMARRHLLQRRSHGHGRYARGVAWRFGEKPSEGTNAGDGARARAGRPERTDHEPADRARRGEGGGRERAAVNCRGEADAGDAARRGAAGEGARAGAAGQPDGGAAAAQVQVRVSMIGVLVYASRWPDRRMSHSLIHYHSPSPSRSHSRSHSHHVFLMSSPPSAHLADICPLIPPVSLVWDRDRPV